MGDSDLLKQLHINPKDVNRIQHEKGHEIAQVVRDPRVVDQIEREKAPPPSQPPVKK